MKGLYCLQFEKVRAFSYGWVYLVGNKGINSTTISQANLEELHDTNLGVSRMKSLAHSYLWWHRMDKAIEELVRSCSICQESRPSPVTAPGQISRGVVFTSIFRALS